VGGEVPTAVTVSTQRPETFEKLPGSEPLPGYRLLAPLGRGGFGEVWKCEAPGGLQKAIKFVKADGERFRQELSAFEQIKAIRHPFFLGLDRVELSGGELVMVMELADCQLQDRFLVCKSDGLPGIPREELVGYLEEAAESLDMISTQYGLQHLDVKPENLFVVAGHAKIGDYGLVRRAERARVKDDDNRGFTPRYTAPEVLLGRVDTRSDQYSLALVYVELLTGSFPYTGRNAKQLMLQHINSAPNLTMLSDEDRQVVWRALAKEPTERFSSCSAFVKELVNAKHVNQNAQAPMMEAQILQDTPQPGGNQTLLSNWSLPGTSRHPDEAIPVDSEVQSRHDATTAVTRRPTIPRSNLSNRPLNSRRSEPPPADPFANLYPVMPVSAFNGTNFRGSNITTLSSDEFVDLVVQSASERLTSGLDDALPTEGVLVVRFLCTLPAAMVPLKLAIVGERWGLTVQQLDQNQFAFWREYKIEPRKPGKSEVRMLVPQRRSGLEVIIRRPIPPSAEFTVLGGLCGLPDDDFARKAHEDLPLIVDQIRGHLQNLAERRAYPRVPSDMPIRVYPLYPDGVVGSPIGGRCQDISVGGLRFITPSPVRTERFYVEFHEVAPVSGQAIYVRIVRHTQDKETQGTITAGRFKCRG
jgi:eukaryotic-like serine/threonine-protein kinase